LPERLSGALLETDPLSMMVHFGLAFALYCERQTDDAIEHAARAVDLYPECWLVHLAMGLALAQTKGLRPAVDRQPGNNPAALAFLLPWRLPSWQLRMHGLVTQATQKS
jgi:hypothetical protein